MKKSICFITALVMTASIATSAFAAVTSESETRTPVNLLTNGSTKVDKNLGIIDGENGTVLNVSKESPAVYLFKSGDYTYSLLDKDENGNYFIFCADRYGKISLNKTAVNNIFDPEPADASDLNLAVYLNNDFLNGTENYGKMTASNSMTEIDPAIKDYIVDHDWYIEGNGQAADETNHLTDTTKNDFSVNCKIALLSWSEYIKYSDKIGYASTQYISNNLTSTHTIFLRTPNASATNLYVFQEKSGNISGSFNVTTTSAPTSAYLRPCFYVSEDYFKHTHLNDIGSAVKNVLKTFTDDELKAAGYKEAEIADIKGTGGDTPDEPTYKSGFVMTDNMEYSDEDITYDESNMTYTKAKQFHLKMMIDIASGNCSVMVGDNLSKPINIPYLGTKNGETVAIGAITFMNRQGTATTNNPAYVDNVKICYDPKGSVVSNISTCSGNIAVSLRDYVVLENDLTSSAVVVKRYDGSTLTVTSVVKSESGAFIIKITNPMTDGDGCYLSIPGLENEYPITQTPFTYTDGTFSASVEITDEKYAQGETAKAVCGIDNTEFTAKKSYSILRHITESV